MTLNVVISLNFSSILFISDKLKIFATVLQKKKKMELRKYFAFITLAIIAIILMQTQSVTSCTCMPTHPQAQYCKSDYGKCEHEHK